MGSNGDFQIDTTQLQSLAAFDLPSNDHSSVLDFDIISCCIVIKQSNKGSIFQVFPRLAIEQSLKITQEDTSSVRIESLIQCLRTGLQFQSLFIETQLLTELIAGTFDLPKSVGVSTTRIPDFSGEGYRAVSSGYQFLGRLSQINLAVDDLRFHHTPEYTSGEIISALLTAKSSDFFDTYRPMKVAPHTTFILIFTVQNHLQTPSPYHLLGQSSIPRSHSVGSFESDSMYLFDQHVSGSSDDSTRASSVDMIQSVLQAPIIPDIPGDSHWERSISPLISDELAENRFSDPPASRRKSPYPARSRNRSGSLSTEDTILLILPSLKPAHESSIFTEAKFVGGNLLTILENHAAMSKLLDVFGLDTSDPARISIFHDQSNEAHKLSARAVLKACGWSESTFTNKGSRYRNAEKAAKMQWKGEEPEISAFWVISLISRSWN
ncbi:hypothetical protein DFH09DRAFT_1068994 [Mycena vulgaris]|nr:hypothetical protein DFH09DRAFT_1068994 [Mycena vulgaris]